MIPQMRPRNCLVQYTTSVKSFCFVWVRIEQQSLGVIEWNYLPTFSQIVFLLKIFCARRVGAAASLVGTPGFFLLLPPFALSPIVFAVFRKYKKKILLFSLMCYPKEGSPMSQYFASTQLAKERTWSLSLLWLPVGSLLWGFYLQMKSGVLFI